MTLDANRPLGRPGGSRVTTKEGRRGRCRVNRRFLYWGILLVALGGVLVAADLGAVDTPALTDALRLWPLAIVAIGLSLVLRKTRWSLAGLMLAAALPGLVLGAAFAVAPRFAGNCGARGEVASAATTEGTFDGPATVFVRSGCGSLNVTTASGSAWRLNAGNTRGAHPGDRLVRAVAVDRRHERAWPELPRRRS